MRTAQEMIAEAKAKACCISADQAKSQIAGQPEVLLLDVREPSEVDQLRVAGFVNVPRGVLEMKIEQLCPDHNKPIYIHCATGGRAALSAVQLEKMGYTNVSVIDCNCDTLVEAFIEPRVE